jgi:caa(3)-type oxidase subunit IV
MEHATETSLASAHKSPNYLLVGGILLALTLIEIAVASFLGAAARPILFILMLAKVTLVAMFYMHLRSESKWFAAFFLAPLPFILMMVAALMIRTCPANVCH